MFFCMAFEDEKGSVISEVKMFYLDIMQVGMRLLGSSLPAAFIGTVAYANPWPLPVISTIGLIWYNLFLCSSAVHGCL